jgi:peptidoglycan/LPS O-acetylase OafA/YrhL
VHVLLSRLLAPFRDNPNRYPLGYYAALDGLRGCLPIGVLSIHLRESFWPGAFVYMDTFFVISAYLITALLLKGWKREGRIAYGSFYYRRALRLFPAAYTMFAVFALAAWLWLDDFPGHMKQVLVAGLYVSNWTRAFDVEMPEFLGHTWSLAIEEQYYLLWPLLLAALLKWSGLRLRSIAIVLGVALAFALWRMWLTLDGAGIDRLYNGTDTRADTLLIGCALGMALAIPAVRENRWVLAIARYAALPCALTLLIAGFTLQWEMRWMYLGGSTLFSCVSALLVAGLVLPQRTNVHGFFEFPPLVFLGRICYGLYLWHFPVYNVLRFGFDAPEFWVGWIGVPLTLLLSVLSFRYIEQPFLRIKDRMPESRAESPAIRD